MPHLSLPVRGELKMVPSIGGIAAAAVAVFVADWLTPLGVLVFVLYVPLCLACLWMASERQAVFMAGFCSVLMILGLFLSPPGVPFVWAVFNRSLGLASLWGALWAGVTFGRRAGQLADALRQSEQEQKAIAERERTRAQQLKRLSEVSLALSGDPGDVFEQVVRTIGELFDVRVVCLSEIVGQELKFKAVYVKGQVFRDAGGCPLDITPCATVEVTKDLRVYDRVMERFPDASFLKDHQAYAYCGFPALDSQGHVVAVTCLLDDRPHAFTEDDQALLRAFGQRIAVEIERARHLDERSQAEAERTKLASVLEASLNELYLFDPETLRFSYVNLGARENLGYSMDRLLAMTPIDLKPEFTEAAFRAMVAPLVRREQAKLVFLTVHRRADGTCYPVEVYLQLVEHDRRRQFLAVIFDITDRKQAEAALRESEARFRQVVERMPNGLVMVDQSGAVTLVNAEAEKMFGYRRDELIGGAIDRLVPNRFQAAHASDRRDYYDSPQARKMGGGRDLFALRKDGSEFPIEIGLTPMKTPQGMQVLASIVDITERKAAETALRESEERYALVVRGTHDGIWDWDVQTGYGYFSTRWKEILGYCDEELPNEQATFFDRIHPDDSKGVREAVVKHLEGQGPYVAEFRLRHKDGSYRWVLSRGEAVRDAEGRPYRMVGSIKDITERKVAEDALRVSEERVRLALTASQQGIFDLDLRTGNAQVSNEYATMLGYDPATFKETNAQWAARMHPEDREKVYRIYEAYIRGENPTYEVEFRQRMKSGEWKWVLSNGSIVERDAEGRPLRMLGTHTDISERKERELALREADARLQEAQVMAKLGNWELDLVSNRLFWSDEIFRIFEIDKTKFAASYEGFLNAIHPDDRAMVNEAYTQSVQNRTPYMIVHRLLMQDGRVKHVMERGETFYDPQGQPRRSVGTVQDITEQRVAELRIEQALQEKEMLLREIHHRVKNNLQLVSSLLYFQSKKVRSDEDLAVIRELQDRITSMILVHEKLYRAGDLAHIVFGDYVRALAESIGRSYERMRGKVEVLVDAQPVTLPVELALPAGLIVNELLTNAFKYAFPNDGSGEVRVRVLNGDGRVEIAVEDTGVGLPAGFELQTSATFGMQLMRGLAAQVGGTITFESARGTAVRLTVPLPE